MERRVKTGLEVVEEILGGFRIVSQAAPDGLVEPETGQRLTVDRFYPDPGIAIQFKDSSTGAQSAPTTYYGVPGDLSSKAGFALIVVDAKRDVPAQTLASMCTALSAAARRIAQRPGSARLDLMPRISTAKASCMQLLEARTAIMPAATTGVVTGATTAVATEPPANRWAGRWQLWRRRTRASLRRFRADWQVLMQNRLAVFGLVLIALFGLMSIAHPVLRASVWKHSMYEPVTGYDLALMHPSMPSRQHLLGTDSLGRDVFSMLLAATTPTFVVGITAALTTAVISTALGVLSAYRRGTTDAILTHVSNAFLLLPAPLFMIIVGMRYRDIGPVALGLIYGLIAGAGGAAILMRAQALQVVVKPFIDAARIAGGGGRRVMLVHVLPHMLPLAGLTMMLAVTGAVVADAFISWFGFTRGYQNWGTMIYSSFIYSSYVQGGVEWHVLIPPSVALSLFAAAFYFVSRGLHEVADPRLRPR